MVTRFQEIVRSFADKTVVCYGIPKARPYFGIEPSVLLKRHGIFPSFYADTFRFGEAYDGQIIISPDELMTLDSQAPVVVVIYCSAVHEIYKSLITLGFRGEIYCLPSFMEEKDGSAFLQSEEKTDAFFEDVHFLRANLYDTVSQEILDAIMEGRKWLSPKSFTKALDLTLSVSGNQPFFIHDVLSRLPKEGMSFVDCGAYNGDTILAMVELGISFKNTFCFEPDPVNYDLLLDQIERLGLTDHISTVKAGVWSETTLLHFNNMGNDSSHVVLEATCAEHTINVVSIDDFFADKQRVDMIKMDIEGAEMEALKGAIKTIHRDRPILAICLYHKFFDLTNIPLFLIEKLENYDFSLRQHDGMAETILYGLPR